MNNKLLDILVCPECGNQLKLDEQSLICKACRLAYPIKDNIPVMLVEQARQLSFDEAKQYE